MDISRVAGCGNHQRDSGQADYAGRCGRCSGGYGPTSCPNCETVMCVMFDELMDSTRTDIGMGRANAALDRQERIIEGLQKLLAILMDRQGLDDLEESLEELRDIKEALESARAELDITDGLLRLSIGLEDVDDIKDDLAQALTA